MHRLHARVPILAAALALAACTGREDTPDSRAETAGQTAVPAAAPPAESRFVLLRGGDTVAVERYTRTGDRLAGEITDATSGARVRYVAAIGPDARVERLELEGFRAGEAAARLRVVATFRGDSIISEQHEGDTVRTQRSAAPPGTLPYLSPSVAMLEQVLRRARAIGGLRVELPVLSISTQRDPELVRPTVTWTADSVFIVMDRENQLRAAVGPDGRILSGSNPPQNVRVERAP